MNLQSLVKKHVEWKFKIPFKNLSPVTSPGFFIKGSEWRLEMRFETFESGEFNFRIYLCKINKDEDLERSFQVTTYLKRENYGLFNSSFVSVYNSEVMIACYNSTSLKNAAVNLLKEGTLEVFCIFHLPASDITDIPNFSMTTTKGVQEHFTVPCKLESLSVDLCNLLSNETFPSDVVVRCGDHTSRAHRAILAARSEVFAAMFRNKMMESETGVVEISDMNVPDFELFLGFLYSGKIEIPSEDSASCLYAAGDKYAIPSLIKACSDYMVQNLSSDNCLRFLQISEKHRDEAFMGSALKFVARNLKGLKREEWFSFSAECPKLALKVYEIHLEGTLSNQVSDREN